SDLCTCTTSANTLANSATGIVSVRWGSAQTPHVSIRCNGVSVGTGNFTGTPSASAPTHTLQQGWTATSIQGYLPEFALYSDCKSLADVQALERYFARQWGINVP